MTVALRTNKRDRQEYEISWYSAGEARATCAFSHTTVWRVIFALVWRVTTLVTRQKTSRGLIDAWRRVASTIVNNNDVDARL